LAPTFNLLRGQPTAQTGIFFSRLPFTQDVWMLAEARLGEGRAEYWSRVWPNPYQAQGHLLEAAQKSLDNGRPALAIACFSSHENKLRENIPLQSVLVILQIQPLRLAEGGSPKGFAGAAAAPGFAVTKSRSPS
jgi:hypothetical protein